MAETGGAPSSSVLQQLQTTSASPMQLPISVPTTSQPPVSRLSQEDIAQIIATVGGQLHPTSSLQINPISTGEGSSNTATSSSIVTYSNAGKICVGGDVASRYV